MANPEQSTDLVREALAQMRALVSEVDAVAERNIRIYKQDELLDLKRKINTPCVGILYGGLQPERDESKTGMVPTLSVDILVIGGTAGNGAEIDSELADRTLELLGDLRRSIKLHMAPGNRKWRFRAEIPVDFGDDLAYVQRWGTTLTLL